MALVLMCGFPASGKTAVADALAALLHENGQQVHIIRDGADAIRTGPTCDSSPTVACARAALYRNSGTEKQTRARLRAATERVLGGARVVICDSLNYIKGFRYELFCAAKTAGTRFCVVHCVREAAACMVADAEREERGEDAYGGALCAELVRRFEMPQARNRWDRPLFEVEVGADGWEAAVRAVWEEGVREGARLMPTMATRIGAGTGGVDVLAAVDRVTREVEGMVVEGMRAGKGVGGKIAIQGGGQVVRLERKPRVAELRNIRQSYLSLARLHPPRGGSREALVGEYVDYVNAQLRVER